MTPSLTNHFVGSRNTQPQRGESGYPGLHHVFNTSLLAVYRCNNATATPKYSFMAMFASSNDILILMSCFLVPRSTRSRKLNLAGGSMRGVTLTLAFPEELQGSAMQRATCYRLEGQRKELSLLSG